MWTEVAYFEGGRGTWRRTGRGKKLFEKRKGYNTMNGVKELLEHNKGLLYRGAQGQKRETSDVLQTKGKAGPAKGKEGRNEKGGPLLDYSQVPGAYRRRGILKWKG